VFFFLAPLSLPVSTCLYLSLPHQNIFILLVVVFILQYMKLVSWFYSFVFLCCFFFYTKYRSLGQEQPSPSALSSGGGGGGGGGGGVTGRVAVMINNLGGTPMLELYVAARSIHTSLESLGFIVARSYVGSFMTSLEMQVRDFSLLCPIVFLLLTDL